MQVKVAAKSGMYAHRQLAREKTMLTFSELILTAAIWILAAAGTFFGLRAAVRRRRKRK